MNATMMNGINGVNGANGPMNMINQAMVNGTGSVAGPVSGPKAGGLTETHDIQTRLNTQIYDYFLKHEQYDCARSMIKAGLRLITKAKGSPGKGQDINSMDDHAGDDSKSKEDKQPDDLPAADGMGIQHDVSWLLDWYSLFWDMFLATHKAPMASQNAAAYVHQQVCSSHMMSGMEADGLTQKQMTRQRDQRFGYMQSGAMQGGMNYNNIMRMPNGMPMKADLQRQMVNRNLYVTPYHRRKHMDELGSVR